MSDKLEYDSHVYSKFRPSLPHNVLEPVLAYLAEDIPSSEWSLAVDVGCGSGQGTNVMAQHFSKVIGSDMNPKQIEQANATNKANNVLFSVSKAETLPLEDKCVQLIGAFSAFHWFDQDQFMTEATLVLMDKGVLAIIGYQWPFTPTDPLAPEDIRLKELMGEAIRDKRLVSYKHKNLTGIETFFQNLRLPDNYRVVRKENIEYTITGVAEDLIGFVKSLSHFEAYFRANKEGGQQMLDEIRDQLKAILNTNSLNDKEIAINYSYYLILAKKLHDLG